MNLFQLGFTESLNKEAQQIDAALIKGRISTQHKGLYRVMTVEGTYLCELPGKFKYQLTDLTLLPAVGDFVLIKPWDNEQKGTIEHVLTRTQSFIRNAAGNETKPQIISANIDYAFLTMSCNDNFNVNRLERYLIATYDSGATPIIVMTKADLANDLDKEIMEAEIQNVAFGVPVYFVSTEEDTNIDILKNYLKPNKTGTLLGSSGVGKSTLINRLIGKEVMQTQAIRESDDKGKHTTTHRELLLIEDGGILIDTPGMREFQLWNKGDNQGLQTEFEDIETLMTQCKFNDCTHQNEPGCQIQAALDMGTLDKSRYERYLKYKRELDFHERKNNEALKREQKDLWKKNTKIGAEMRRLKGNRR